MKWYPVPGYSIYEASELGEIRNRKTGRVLKTWGYHRYGRRKDRKVNLCGDGTPKGKRVPVHRVVLSAKLGRPLESWEHCCHGPGGRDDHSMANLSVGDAINNSIDCVERGERGTSLEQVRRAIKRLRRLQEALEGASVSA